MNTEQLRNMIENQSLEPYLTDEDNAKLHVKTNRVTDLIVDTLSKEFINALSAEDGNDYYFKACDYVRKLYMALKGISNKCWRDFISNVGSDAECSTRLFITANHEYLEADEVHRYSYLAAITSTFRDFVFTFYTLQHIMKKTCDDDLDIEAICECEK